jgi:hypothetical protein
LLPILREKVNELKLEEKRDKSKSNVVTSAFGEAFYKNLSLKKKKHSSKLYKNFNSFIIKILEMSPLK